MGFVPIAFRAGSAGKRRIHIFWQRRIRAGDEETPWWYPFKTAGGAIGQDRLVLPIPPGMHWSELERAPLPEGMVLDQKALPGVGVGAPKRKRVKKVAKPVLPKETDVASGGLRFRPKVAEGARSRELCAEEARSQELGAIQKPEAEKAAKPKFDPKLEAYARELRDRWQERVAEEPWMVESRGKYDVTRQLVDQRPTMRLPDAEDARLLPAA
jgi:hypothetical protein